MDPIKNFISATDPVHNDPSVPDGEAALRRMLAEPAAFTDSLRPNVTALADRKRQRARLAGVLTLAAAAVTAGVLVATNLGALTTAPEPANTGTVSSTAASTPTPTRTPTPTATPTPTTTPVPVPPAVPWTLFSDATGQATFEHPAGWTVSEAPEFGGEGAFNTVEVKNPAGKTMATLNLVYDGAAGPACPAPKPFSTLDSVVVDISQKTAKLKEFPRGPSAFVFRVVQGDKVYGSVALTDIELAPDTTTCGLYNGILAPDDVPFAHFGDAIWLTPDGQRNSLAFDTVADARAYMSTPEYQDTKRMLVSLSLRPTSKEYTNAAADVSFKLPVGWTAKDVPAGTPDFPASGIQITDETGKKVARFYHGAGGGLGGACGPEGYKATELDSGIPTLPAQWAHQAKVRFSYRVLDQTSVGKGFSYQVGLVDKSSGQLTDSCLMYSVVSGAPRGSLSFADRDSKSPDEPVFQSMAEAKAYMGTQEYKKLKNMILSIRMPAQG
ncbi:hypothetical protein NKCBBBOE_01451 [Pseudarthrobacter sp. MM222]|nr:hypothetical protein NKCBBBOE_01451 [Pseudarthrobacter sp. MM222]